MHVLKSEESKSINIGPNVYIRLVRETAPCQQQFAPLVQVARDS